MPWSLRNLFRSRLRAPARNRPLAVVRLEDRDVPATFYVDPNAMMGSTSFNVGQPGRVDGLVFGTNLFTTFEDGVAAAEASPGADTLRLAVSTTAMNGGFVDLNNPNPAASLLITQSLDVIGSGAGATILSQLLDSTVPIIQAQGAGVVANFSNLSFFGGATGFDDMGMVAGGNQTPVYLAYTAGATGTVTGAAFQGIFQNGFQGTAVAVAGAGASVTVQDSSFSAIGRIGVSVDGGATANVFGNTYAGKGAIPAQDYFVQVTNGSSAVVSGNTASGNQGSAGGPASSAVFISGNSTAQIFGNEFTGNTVGVLVGSGMADTSNVSPLQYNNIFGNGIGVGTNRSAMAGPVIALNNFWGDATGPFNATNNPTGLGNAVANDVVFQPFRTAAVPVLAAPTLAAYLAAAFPPPVTPPVAAFTTSSFGGQVAVVNTQTQQQTAITAPFGGIPANSAVTDFTGDGVPDVVLTPQPGGGPVVVVVNGSTGATIASFPAFPEAMTFRGGLSVAAGDVTGDGTPDIVVAVASAGGPIVRVFDGRTFTMVTSFFAFSAAYMGGVNVAVGDVNGDGRADIIAATAGPSATAQVKVIDGTRLNLLDGGGMITTAAVISAFEPYFGFQGGVSVAAGNFDGDKFADIAITPLAGGGAVYTTLLGKDVAVGNVSARVTRLITPAASFFGGFTVSVSDVNANGLGDVVVTPAPKSGGGALLFGFDPLTGAQLLGIPTFNGAIRV